MEIALRYKLFTLSTLFTLFYSVFTSLLPPLTLFKLFTYCIHIVEWFERHEKALWLDEQNKISFAANLRIEEIVPLNTYENTYRSWKIGSEEKDGGAKHWRRIAHNKHHFPEIEIFIDKDTEDNDKGISLSTRATTCQIVHRHQHSKELQCKMQGGSLRQTSLPADPSL